MRRFLFLFFTCSIVFSQIKEDQNPNERAFILIKKSKESTEKNRLESLSYLQEALKYENSVSDSTLRTMYNQAGLLYQSGESLYMSLNYFYRELELQNKIDKRESFFVLNNIGGCYYLLGNYKKARKFWEESLVGFEHYLKSNKNTSKVIEASIIYNNLAVLENIEGNYAKALEMLKEFQLNNKMTNDTINMILAHENLADVYLKLKNNNEAYQQLWKASFLAKKKDLSYDQANLFYKLGETYFSDLMMSDSSKYYLDKAYELSEKHGYVDVQLNSSQELVKFFEKKKDYQQAFYYLSKAKSLSEEVINNENVKKVNRLELEFNEKVKQNDLIEYQNKRERFFVLGIFFLLLFSMIIFLMFKLQKSKTLKRIAENKLLSQELELKNKELTNNAMQILQTNEILETTHKDLRVLKEKNNIGINDRMLSKIISDLKLGRQGFNKKEFEKVFMETNEEFYKKLLNDFPNLTKNEIRLCAFLRMNLSSKEISAITQQSPHSIVVARSRLRKKIDLAEGENLNTFFIQF